MKECTNKKYFFYYVRTNELKCVEKNAFLKSKADVVVLDDSLIRVVGSVDKKLLRCKFRNLNLRAFEAQSIGQDIFSMIDGLTLVLTVLRKIGETKKVIKGLDEFIVLDLIKLVSSVIEILKNGISVQKLVNFIIDGYLLIKRNVFKAQMLEAVCLASLSMFLPNALFEIIKRMSLFSSSKMIDDFSGFHTLFICVLDAINYFITTLSLPDCLKDVFYYFLKFLKIGEKHLLIKEVENLINKVKKDSKILLSESFRIEVSDLNVKINSESTIIEWRKKSNTINALLVEFSGIVKRCLSYESTSRVEPVCFVFEGLPGCGKSMTMNKVLDGLCMSKYSHIVKSNMDGKDWYDSYNNEEIFYMDDVGQQSASQFRTLINMVSEVKYPLDCADAKLKDTKFFNSEVILLTTNKFEGLQNLTKDDCISDIRALWRRAFVFDFKEVVRDDFNTFKGMVRFKYFNVKEGKFLNDFPEAFKKYILDESLTFNVLREGEILSSPLTPNFSFAINSYSELLIWCCSIIKYFNNMNKKRNISNKLNQQEILDINKCVNYKEIFVDASFASQMFATHVEIGLTPRDMDLMSIVREGLEANIDVRFFEIGKCQWYWEVFKEFFGDITKILFKAISNIGEAPVLLSIFIYCLIGVLPFLRKMFNTDFKAETEDVWSRFVKNPHTSVDAISKAVLPVDLYFDNVRTSTLGLLSGHYLIVPAHAGVLDKCYLTVFKDLDKNYKLIEHVRINLVNRNDQEDWSLYQLPSNMAVTFKNLSSHFKISGDSDNLFLSNYRGSIAVNSIKKNFSESRVYKVYIPNFGTVSHSFNPSSSLFYDLQQKGLCGSIVIDSFSGIKGMHVAGSSVHGLGVSMLWSQETIQFFHDILLQDKFILDVNMSERKLENVSVQKIVKDCHTVVPKYTNYVPTLFMDVFPISRFPANLQKYGPCTVKDIAKKSFSPTVFVKENELNFGSNLLDFYFKNFEFKILPENEIVGGNDDLASLNKDSSNGYSCVNDKSYYIDFENKSFTPIFKQELEFLEESILNGKPEWDKFVWVETLKDELRGVEKEGKPRSFRVGTIHQQVLMKKYFAWLVVQLIKTRSLHQIAVGINPIKEWPEMYEKLLSTDIIFAGDIATWDGGMLPQVQDRVSDAILRVVESSGDERSLKICKFLLEMTTRSIVAVLDDCYITTHSMPSGSFLTAIFNSLVNKFYTAMWFHRNVPTGSILDLVDNVIDYVYGDDKLNGVRKFSKNLNAITMRDFFQSLGMDFTDSVKKPIVKEGQTMDEITFLKRNFVYHNELNQIVCPLDLRTLYSSLGFCDIKKELDVVLKDKIHCFQREIYLHTNRQDLFLDFESIMNSLNFPFEKLTKEYLYYLFKNDFKPTYLMGFDKF